LERQLAVAKALQAQDSAERVPVALPGLLAKKYPYAEHAERWAWLFPSKSICRDPRANKLVRWRCHESNVQRAMPVRVRWRAPNPLGFALACFRRAIRAHRRLARLAPSFFDSAVIERNRRQQESRRRWLEEAELALRKVYGPSADPRPPVPELPPLPPSRTRIAVERELESWRIWFGLGSYALQQSKLYYRYSLVNLNRLALLLETASDLERLATGADSPQPNNEPDIYATAWSDLERIYGDHQVPAPSSTAHVS
jgi:hypothetical protein